MLYDDMKSINAGVIAARITVYTIIYVTHLNAFFVYLLIGIKLLFKSSRHTPIVLTYTR